MPYKNLMTLGLLALALTSPAASQDEGSTIPFISHAPDGDYASADATLVDYLQRTTKLTFSPTPSADYDKAIDEVVRRPNSPYVARLTPYPCVVAELKGAKFEILATYTSRATKSAENPKAQTYHSYFVVNTRRPGSTFSAHPSLREIDEFLKAGTRVFLYHDKFSTSSYFIPLNYFRGQRVFHLEQGQPPGTLTPIDIRQTESGKGSSDLVAAVLEGKADIAAVWDGTKKKFETDESSPLRFVRIDPALPNDLLVASTSLGPERLDALREAIRKMPCGERGLVFAGDFECWDAIAEAREAREALADLRQLAIAPPAPVTIRISLAAEKDAAQAKAGAGAGDRSGDYLEAARQAVRLAGSEFVLFDPDFHRWADLDWKLKVVHDGALELTSVVNGIDEKKVEKQTFSISFADADEELTRRIVGIIHTRLNRIRYVWPFDNRTPTILRDVGFALQPGSHLWVQKIVWIDPKKNQFTLGNDFEAEVKTADFHKFQLDPRPFQEMNIDPMSNSALRVILVRPTPEQRLFRYLTAALVALFALGGIASGVDLYRTRGTPKA
jgi:ABC-type phosphate/phosphonate transport system substrate-binding protein